MTTPTDQITYIGHGTTLIRLAGKNFLTDPNFSKKTFLRGKRLSEPGMAPQDLPKKIHAILISHACYDHLDLFSYKYFSNHTPIICPKGLGAFIQRFCANPITEIAPGKVHEIDGVKVHGVEIKKRGFRWLPIRYGAANGYVLASDTKEIYFAGNTAYGTHFKKVGEKFQIDTALLPLDTDPKAEKKSSSLNVQEFLKAGEKLKAKTLIPIRWGVFKHGPKLFKKTQARLEKLPEAAGLLHCLKIGESFKPSATAPAQTIKLASIEGKRVDEKTAETETEATTETKAQQQSL